LQGGLMYPKVRFTGIDLYEAEEARGISRLIGASNCRFYGRDALRMNIKRKFDFVVLFMALGNICETTSDARVLVANCLRLMKKDAKLLVVEPFEEDFPKEVREKLRRMYRFYKAMGRSRGEDHETILSRNSTLRALRDSGFGIVEVLNKRFEWHMRRDAVARYFGFEPLPIDLPERFWVLDKPRQVTVVIAKRADPTIS